jgi:hypothetical protein
LRQGVLLRAVFGLGHIPFNERHLQAVKLPLNPETHRGSIDVPALVRFPGSDESRTLIFGYIEVGQDVGHLFVDDRLRE